jgi:hypothetical protein
MATTITKLFSTGVLQSGVIFDEVTYNTIKISTSSVYAAQFDEVSLPTSTAERRTNTGTYMVSGYFDEWTLPSSIITLYYSSTTVVTSTITSYTLPSTVQAGDLIVIFELAGDNTISTNPNIFGPSGYTNVLTDWASSNSTIDADAYGWWYKIATASDANTTVSYASPDINATFRNSALYLFRKGVPINAVSVGSVNFSSDKNITSATTQTAQTVTTNNNFPVIIFGSTKASSGSASLNLNSVTSTITQINSQVSTGFTIPSVSSATPITVSMTRTGGNFTFLASFYLAIS